MSGLKYSKIEIEQETKARQKALNNISIVRKNIEELKRKIKTGFDQIPEQVKKSFHSESEKIKKWYSNDIPSPDEKMNSQELNEMLNKLNGIYKEGEEMLRLLIEIKEVRREEKEKKLLGEVETLKTQLEGMKELLNKWKKGSYENLNNSIDEIVDKIEKGAFIEVENGINKLDEILKKNENELIALEEQDRERYYVLDPLKKVCEEMGWKVNKEPELEEKDKADSPLIFEVDTFNAGIIKFSLTLEGINVNSQISNKEGACYKEFGNFSEKLKKFGVITKFERLSPPKEEPKLQQKGELDLPDSAIEIEKEI